MFDCNRLFRQLGHRNVLSALIVELGAKGRGDFSAMKPAAAYSGELESSMSLVLMRIDINSFTRFSFESARC
jgi:hypothetical protein